MSENLRTEKFLWGGIFMTYEEIMNIWNEKNEADLTKFFPSAKKKTPNYQMIVLANLSQNTYLIKQSGPFLYNEVCAHGCYDDLIDDNMENIHPNYQRLFYESFSREDLFRSFQRGKTEVYAKLYQKDTRGQYHWVSVHVIRVESKSGDVMLICFNRVLEDADERRYGHK